MLRTWFFLTLWSQKVRFDGVLQAGRVLLPAERAWPKTTLKTYTGSIQWEMIATHEKLRKPSRTFQISYFGCPPPSKSTQENCTGLMTPEGNHRGSRWIYSYRRFLHGQSMWATTGKVISPHLRITRNFQSNWKNLKKWL